MLMKKNKKVSNDYDIFELQSPIDKDSFDDFSKEEAAIYFAEVIRRNNANILHWGYFTKPKSRMSVNEPVLLGFVKGMDMNPHRIVYNCTLDSIREPEKNRLFDLYHVWMEYVE